MSTRSSARTRRRRRRAPSEGSPAHQVVLCKLGSLLALRGSIWNNVSCARHPKKAAKCIISSYSLQHGQPLMQTNFQRDERAIDARERVASLTCRCHYSCYLGSILKPLEINFKMISFSCSFILVRTDWNLDGLTLTGEWRCGC